MSSDDYYRLMEWQRWAQALLSAAGHHPDVLFKYDDEELRNGVLALLRIGGNNG